MITLSLGGFTALEQGGEQTEAEALAQEAIEAVRSIRDRVWNEMIYTTSSVSVSSSQWIFDGETTTETIGKYLRIINFFDVCRDNDNHMVDCPGSYLDIQSKKIIVNVSWEVRPGVNNEVEKTTYLTNWASTDWVQTDWSGGNEQTNWLDINKYDSDDEKIDTSIPGQIILKKQNVLATSTFDWDFNTSTDCVYDLTKITLADGTASLIDFGETGFCAGLGEFCSGWIDQVVCEEDLDCSWTLSENENDLYPTSSLKVLGLEVWEGFIETADKNDGEIYYQLSDDGGATWQYWDGEEWSLAGVVDYNPADLINTNVPTFNTSTGQIMFKAFLKSNEGQPIILDNVQIEYLALTESDNFETSGVFLSSAYDMNDVSPAQILSWSEDLSGCENCGIKLQLRVASTTDANLVVWSDWYEVDDTNTDQVNLVEKLLPTDLNWKQLVQYQAELFGDGESTPVLQEIKINYK